MMLSMDLCFFFFNDTATTEIYTLSLHDALPIWRSYRLCASDSVVLAEKPNLPLASRCRLVRSNSSGLAWDVGLDSDRKSTRLNSSHSQISYAVFCLKKQKTLNVNCFVRDPVTGE